MKSLLPVVALYLILFWSCHPLNLENNLDDESSNTTDSQERSLDDGDKTRVNVCYGDWDSLVVQIPIVENTGYIKISLAAASDEAVKIDGSDLVVKIYDKKPLIGNSMYDPYIHHDSDNNIFEYYFVSDSSKKYILLYHEDSSYENSVFNLSVESFNFAIEAKEDSNVYIERTLSSGVIDSFSVPYWGKNVYEHLIKEIEIDQVYSLVVSWDRTNTVLPPDRYTRAHLNLNNYDLDIEKYFEMPFDNANVYIFKIISDEGITGIVEDSALIDTRYCFTGDSMQFDLKISSPHSFADDVYEHDQGPISATPDTLDSVNTTSGRHTITNGDEDWIVWHPWGTGSYRFSIKPEYAWYVDNFTEDLNYMLNIQLIDSNGAEILDSNTIYLTEAPVTLIVNSDTSNFTLAVDSGVPYFLCIKASSDLSYRIIAEKL